MDKALLSLPLTIALVKYVLPSVREAAASGPAHPCQAACQVFRAAGAAGGYVQRRRAPAGCQGPTVQHVWALLRPR